MQEGAIVLANDLYQTPNGKVAHGLIRGSERFRVLAVVDPGSAGEDAGRLLDGRHRDIPVVATLQQALEVSAEPARCCVVGIATHGGKLTDALRVGLREAAALGLDLVNGLHDCIADDPEITAAARSTGARIVDLRRVRPRSELHFWTGAIGSVRAPRIAVLGMDCAIGKRTTARLLTQALRKAEIRAEMIYTGQTGWMQGGRYGFVFDAVVNDYVCGELEHACVTCDREIEPDVMILEGQSSLRNPSGPCGSEFLLAAAARAVVLQHAPGRVYFEGYHEEGYRIPSVSGEIDLIAAYGARTLALTLHGQGLTADALARRARELEDELGIPVVCPLQDGLDRLAPVVRSYIEEQRR